MENPSARNVAVLMQESRSGSEEDWTSTKSDLGFIVFVLYYGETADYYSVGRV
jgi:hypothetical protein